MKKILLHSANEHQRFSIRKLTIGVASVLIGTAFYLNNGATSVQADTTTSSGNSDQTTLVQTKDTNQQQTSDKQTDQVATVPEQNEKQQANTQDNKANVDLQKTVNTSEDTPTATPAPKANDKIVSKQPSSASPAKNENQQTQPVQQQDSAKENKTNTQTNLNQTNKQLAKNNSKLLATSFRVESEPAKEISDDNYSVSNVKGTAVNHHDNVSSHEDLTFQLNIHDPSKINEGDYLDINWGIPYTDENGNQQIRALDPIQEPTKSIEYQNHVIGSINQNGSGYRLVFNHYISTLGHPVGADIDLQWANAQNAAGANNKPLKKYTNVLADNGKQFSTTIPDDVQIGNKKYNSTLAITGKLVYSGKSTNANGWTAIGPSYGFVRTWNPDSSLNSINTNWFNTFFLTAQLNNTGHNFTVTINVPNNHYWNYNWYSEDNVIQQIKDNIANPTSTQLTNKVNNQNIYLDSNQITYKAPDPGNITVTRTINDNWTDPNRSTMPCYLVTYHINIPNKDALLKGGITFLVVSHDGFTLPTDIHNGNEDWADSVRNDRGGNFGPWNSPNMGARTGNKKLWDSLNNTGIAYGSVVNNETGKTVTWGGGSWGAGIGVLATGSAYNHIDISDLVTAHLSFKDDTDPADIKDIPEVQDAYFEQESNTPISFNNSINDTLKNLLDNGYKLDKVILEGSSTDLKPDTSSDVDKLTSYNYGKLEQTKASSSTGQMEFVVYLKKATEEKAHVLYYDDTSNGFITKQADGSYTTTTDTNKFLEDNAHATKANASIGIANTNLQNLQNKHYLIVGITPAQLLKNIASIQAGTANNKNFDLTNLGTFDSDTKTDQYFVIHLKHDTKQDTQTATITETIKGYYEDGDKLHLFNGISDPTHPVDPADETGDPDHSVVITFTRTRDTDLVTGNTTAWSDWSANNNQAIHYDNGIIKDGIAGNYYLDKKGIVHIASNKAGLSITASQNGINQLDPSIFLSSLADGNNASVSITIWVPYHQVKEQNPNPGNNPGSQKPTNPPTESKTTPPTEPQQPTQQTQFSEKQDQPTDIGNNKKPIKEENPWATNNNPHGEINQRRGHSYNYNNAPKGERNNYNYNNPPKGERNNYNYNNPPKGEKNPINTTGPVKGSTLATKLSTNKVNTITNKQNTLPQTGENKSNLGIIGLGIAALAVLFGLDYDQNKRKN